MNLLGKKLIIGKENCFDQNRIEFIWVTGCEIFSLDINFSS